MGRSGCISISKKVWSDDSESKPLKMLDLMMPFVGQRRPAMKEDDVFRRRRFWWPNVYVTVPESSRNLECGYGHIPKDTMPRPDKIRKLSAPRRIFRDRGDIYDVLIVPAFLKTEYQVH